MVTAGTTLVTNIVPVSLDVARISAYQASAGAAIVGGLTTGAAAGPNRFTHSTSETRPVIKEVST
jgi:hypothetical protein